MRAFSAVAAAAALALSWASLAQAARPRLVPKPVSRPASSKSAATTGEAYFEQLLDHHNPDKGAFSQRYWWSTEYWGGPGSPVRL